MGKTHRTGSIALACGILAAYPAEKVSLAPAVTFLVASAIGGLFPDADTPYSTYGRRWFFLLWPFYLIRKVLSLLGNLVKPFKDISKALGHRGLFHSPVLWTIIFGIIFVIMRVLGVENIIAYSVLFGGYTGIISHVFLDFISGGVPLFAPFDMKRYSAPVRFRTGGAIEWIFSIAFVAISVTCMIYGILPRFVF